MSVELQSEVETWFARAQGSQMLRDFLADVRTPCEAIEEALGPAVVRAVYSRGDKQENGEILKSFPKIAIALAKQRRSRPDASILTVEDIIGLTIVVYYPDEAALVLERLRAHAGLHVVNPSTDAPKITNGYYAHHVVMRSNDPRHYNAHCEVQIKTMMHDAWAAKMHDLVYKPQGHTDKRLSTMMNVFGEALQSIETQSELLRNLIHERWNAEVKRRRACAVRCLPRFSAFVARSARRRIRSIAPCMRNPWRTSRSWAKSPPKSLSTREPRRSKRYGSRSASPWRRPIRCMPHSPAAWRTTSWCRPPGMTRRLWNRRKLVHRAGPERMRRSGRCDRYQRIHSRKFHHAAADRTRHGAVQSGEFSGRAGGVRADRSRSGGVARPCQRVARGMRSH